MIKIDYIGKSLEVFANFEVVIDAQQNDLNAQQYNEYTFDIENIAGGTGKIYEDVQHLQVSSRQALLDLYNAIGCMLRYPEGDAVRLLDVPQDAEFIVNEPMQGYGSDAGDSDGKRQLRSPTEKDDDEPMSDNR